MTQRNTYALSAGGNRNPPASYELPLALSDQERIELILQELSPVLTILKGMGVQLISGNLRWAPQFVAGHPGHIEIAFPLTERKSLTIPIQWGILSPEGIAIWEHPEVEALLRIASPETVDADPFATTIVVPRWSLAWRLVCEIMERVRPTGFGFHSM